MTIFLQLLFSVTLPWMVFQFFLLQCWIICVSDFCKPTGRPLSVSFLFRLIVLTTTLRLNSNRFYSNGIVLSCLVCNVRQLMWASCCIEKWPRDWCRLQAAQAGVLWTGAHVRGCHDIPGLWHCHLVWLPQRFPQSCGLREVPPRPRKRGTEGR